MRLKLSCRLFIENVNIDYNYREKLRSFVYFHLEKYDKKISVEIHDSNNIADFSISRIDFTKFTNSQNGICVQNTNFSFVISSFNIKIIEAIKNTINTIYDFGYGFIFKIDNIQNLDLNVSENSIFYSEFLMTKKTENGKIISYLPTDVAFKEALFKNLIKKYNNITGENRVFDISAMDIIFNCNINDRRYSGLEKFKNYKLKYFKFRFKLICPIELIKIAYINGIGEKNNSGFGFIKIVK